MENLTKKIKDSRDYVIELQKGLISRPALSPDVEGGEGEYDKAQFLLSEVKKLKFDEVTVIDAPDARAKHGVRPNIVAKYYGKNKEKTLWIMGHMDIVHPGDMEKWKTNPYEAVIDGDKIYGRGAEDNNQGIVSSMVLARAMMELDIRPEVNVGLLLVADEEVGCKYGIEYITKNHKDIFGPNDFFITPDSGNPEGTFMEIAEKAVIWFKFVVEGKEGHASTPHKTINACRAGSHFIAALDELYKIYPETNDLFDAPPFSTFEPTKHELNVGSANIIPGKDVIWYDVRLLPHLTAEEVMAKCLELAKPIEEKFKVKITGTIEKNKVSKATDINADIVKLYIKAIEHVFNKTPKPVGIGGGTASAFVRNMGLPAVVGGTQYATLHQPNEYSSITFTLQDACVMAYVAFNTK
ncbi:succinyl-diaminopimelate desuccinylase [Elusimicrobium simillimum]|uniref:M20 family metallo-hydrolase n=1 Tax=Elusimicrobium simillimum TaxID=3143438 RepID=UPI003C6EBD04